MAFRIRETRGIDARRVERVISMRVLVCPGVEIIDARFHHDELRREGDRVMCVRPGWKSGYAPGLRSDQMREVMLRLPIQARTWRPFAVTEHPARRGGHPVRYDYRFELEFVESAEKCPVLDTASNGGDPPMRVDDTSRPGRLHASVNVEKRRRGCDCVIIVHPNLGGQNAHAIILDEGGNFRSPGHQSTPMTECSNLMRIDFDHGIDEAGALTGAHEVGHCLGLGDALPVTVHGTRVGFQPLMLSAQGAPRELTDRDMVPLHQVVQTFNVRQGVIWEGTHPPARDHAGWGRTGPRVEVVL